MITPQIPNNVKERMQLHLAYKKRMKEIISAFLCDSVEAIENLDDDSSLDDMNKIIDQWVETRFMPAPYDKWKEND